MGDRAAALFGRARVACLATIFVAVLATAAPAGAATVFAAGGCDPNPPPKTPSICASRIEFRALPGEVNTVAFTAGPAERQVRVTDTTAPVTAQGGCEQVAPREALCTPPPVAPATIFFDTGDGPDAVSLTASAPANGTLGPGDDRLTTSSAADAGGGDGNDVMTSTGAGSLLDGGAGSDTLTGGAGSETLTGGSGADELRGGGGDDVLKDGDTVATPDLFDGGEGVDTISYDGRPTRVGVDLAQAEGGASGEADRFAGLENVQGGGGDDTLAGTAGASKLDGGAGDDLVFGQLGDDVVDGGAGDDVLDGSAGDDRLDGGPGADRILSGDGRDGAQGGSGDDRISGDAGNDRIGGNSGKDRLTGSAGRDVLVGGSGADTFRAGPGNDRVLAGEGGPTKTSEAIDCGEGSDRVEDPNARDRLARSCERALSTDALTEFAVFNALVVTNPPRLLGGGRVGQRITCPKRAVPRSGCRGTVTLTSTSRGRRPLGRRRYRIPRGRSGLVAVELTPRGRAAFRRSRKVQLRATVKGGHLPSLAFRTQL